MLAALTPALQFFRVVRPVPRLMRVTFAVVTTASAARLLLGSDTVAPVLLPILLLQTFAVSTGFMGYARRGHFDLLLTRGAGRVPVAAPRRVRLGRRGTACPAPGARSAPAPDPGL